MIAIPATGPGIGARVDPRFGRCSCFLLVDPDTLAFELLENTAAMEITGAGPAAANLVAASGVSAVLASGLGINAIQVLRSAGILVYRVRMGTVKQAVQGYQSGAIPLWWASEPADDLARLEERAKALRNQLDETQGLIRDLKGDGPRSGSGDDHL